MMELISPANLAKLLPMLLVINIVLSAAWKVLDVLKAQDKAPWLSSVAGFIQKIIDMLSANMPH